MKLELIRKNSTITACTLGDSIDFSGDQLLESPMLLQPMPMRRFTLPIEQTATDLLPSMELRDFSEQLEDPFQESMAIQNDQFEFNALFQDIRLEESSEDFSKEQEQFYLNVSEVLAETKTVNEYSFQDGSPSSLEEDQGLDQ